MDITITGTGYVGLVTAACLAEIGNCVTCVDVDKEKILKLNQGIIPIFEPGLENLIRKNNDRLYFTTDYKSAYLRSDVIYICVGTPEKKDGAANLKYVYEAAEQIAQSARKECIVIIKSTVPIGTNDKIEAYIRERCRPNINIEVASNPEFLAQGTAIRDTMNASRIVIGVKSRHAEIVLRGIYDAFKQPYVITDTKSAEMIKYASNDFLALKISYINEIANMCEITGANIEDVALGMGFDHRIGDKFLKAGIGYGGSCFPKDTKALHWLSNFHDYEIKTIKAAIEVNESQKIKPIKKARKYFESFKGLNVAVLGLTFKPETDDLREAPSIPNISILIEEGASIKAWDPAGIESYKKIYPTEISYCQTIQETLKDTEVCFIFTEWADIKRMDTSLFAKLMSNPLVIDGRNCFRLDSLPGKGIIYESIGRKTVGSKNKAANLIESTAN